MRDELTWSKGLLNNEMRTSISVTDANMLREEATHLQQILEQEKSPFSTTEISLKESEEKLQREIRHHHHDVVILQRHHYTLLRPLGSLTSTMCTSPLSFLARSTSVLLWLNWHLSLGCLLQSIIFCNKFIRDFGTVQHFT